MICLIFTFSHWYKYETVFLKKIWRYSNSYATLGILFSCSSLLWLKFILVFYSHFLQSLQIQSVTTWSNSKSAIQVTSNSARNAYLFSSRNCFIQPIPFLNALKFTFRKNVSDYSYIASQVWCLGKADHGPITGFCLRIAVWLLFIIFSVWCILWFETLSQTHLAFLCMVNTHQRILILIIHCTDKV